MSPEPRFRRLAREGLLTPPTLRALAERETPFEGTPRFFAEDEFQTLTALVDRLRPPYDRPTAREIALRIDLMLAEGRADGWRYDAMPPDGEAHRLGLKGIQSEGPLDDDLIRRLQRGEARAAWPIPPQRFLEDLLAHVVTHAYAHPCAQDAIAYDGYADAKGWSHLALGDTKEPWE